MKKREEAFNLLREYNGENPYILNNRLEFFSYGNNSVISDFFLDYVIRNCNYKPRRVMKMIGLVDWFAEKKKEEWGIDFTPEKVYITWIIGETEGFYHCFLQYRQSVNPSLMFVPKNGLMSNPLATDYNKIEVDFDRYDKLCSLVEPGRRLREHQKTAVKFMLSRKKCILADDMGLGKTSSLCVSAIEGNFDSVLIICPASVKESVWKRELLYYVPDRDITVIESFDEKKKDELEKILGYGVGRSGKKKEELLEEAKERGKWSDNRFVIINYEILADFCNIPSSRSKYSAEETFKNSPILKYLYGKKSLVIIDEAHRLSNKDSLQYKTIKYILRNTEPDSVYLSTGTPVTNNPMNLYCILNLIENEITGDYDYYVNRYCGAFKFPAKGEKDRWTGYYLKNHHLNSVEELNYKQKNELKEYIKTHARMIRKATGGENLDELKSRISHIYIRRLKEDNNEMVKKTIHEKFYDLSYEQEKKYDELWDEYENAQLDIDPTKVLNKDLLEGAIYRKYLSNEMVPNTIKLANSFIEQGEKVVIACCYDEELYTLKEYYGDICVIYNGKTSPKQKVQNEDKFQHDPNIKVFIGNIDAAGVGLSLTASRILIFNNISFVPGDNQQMCDRVCRLSSTRDVDIYYQFFTGTQYEKMWNTVLRKTLMIDQIIKKEDDK